MDGLPARGHHHICPLPLRQSPYTPDPGTGAKNSLMSCAYHRLATPRAVLGKVKSCSHTLHACPRRSKREKI